MLNREVLCEFRAEAFNQLTVEVDEMCSSRRKWLPECATAEAEVEVGKDGHVAG